jgi:hypothetical protein
MHAVVSARLNVRKLFIGTLVLGVLVVGWVLIATSVKAAPGINEQMNFQGRLFNSQGAVVPDGYYNIQFKIYQDGNGDTAGNPGGTLEWTEEHLGDDGNGVQVKNGFLSVQLGSVTPFGSSIDWNQDTLWLSMNIGDTNTTCTPFANCSPDGEMVPMKRLSANPYALNAGRVGGLTSSDFVQLAQGVQTDAANGDSIQLNKTGTGDFVNLQSSGTDVLTLTGTGDIEFGANADHAISVADSAASTAGYDLAVVAGNGGTGNTDGGDLVLQGGAASGTGTSGSVIVKSNDSNSTTAFQVQDSTGTSVLNVNTSTGAVSAGSIQMSPYNASAETSLWEDSATTGSFFENGQPITLGVKFKSSTSGYIKGLKFYNSDTGNQNVNNVTARLWECDNADCTSTGSSLGSHSFASDTTEGWKEGTFASPIYVSADTYYIASIYTTDGEYRAANGYFDTSSFTNENLTAPASGTTANGVYANNADVFPTSTFFQNNYWVDMVYSSSTGDDVITSSNALTLSAGGDLTVGTTDQILSLNGSSITLDGTVTLTDNVTVAGGMATIGGASQAGSLVLYDGTGETVTFSLANQTSSFTLTVPDAGGDDTVCLLNLANCGSAGAALQDVYDNSTGGTTPEIKLDGTRGALDIQDADTTIGANLFNVRASNAAGLGDILFGVGNTGAITMQNSADSASAFRILNDDDVSLVNLDSLGDELTIGSILPTTHPTIEDVVPTTGSGFQTSTTIDLPDDPEPGELFLVFAGARHETETVFPAGWTRIADQDSGETDHSRLAVAYRVSDGTETDVTVTSNASFHAKAFLVSGHDPNFLPEATTTSGTSATAPDPPSISPSWGDSSTLAFAFTSLGLGGGPSVTTYPCADTDSDDEHTTQFTTAICSDETSGSSINPGAFTMSANDGWAAATVVVSPGVSYHEVASQFYGDMAITSGGLTLESGHLDVNGNGTFSGDLAVNGGDVTSTGDLAVNTNGTTRATFDTSNNLYLGNGITAASPNDFTISGTGSTTTGVAGGAITIQGGNATVGNANGGNVTLAGGDGVGTGVKGLVVLETPTISTSSTQNCASNCNVTQANVDSSGAVLIDATAAGLTVSLPDPTNSTAGRIMYVTNIGTTNDFTLSVNGGGTGNLIAMKPNTTATMIWNGSDWTAAGASSSTDLQSAYNNTLTSAGGAELVLNAAGGSADGLTIRNNATDPINGGILEVQSSIGTNLFSVNDRGEELAANGGAETQGASASTFPASTWEASGSSTISRTTTSGEFVTGQAGVEIDTTTTNGGVLNNLTDDPIASTTYQVSFAVKASVAINDNLEVIYTPDGGSNNIECTPESYSTQDVSTSQWTKVTCTIETTAASVTDPDLIIRQTDAPSRTIWIDNLSFVHNNSTTDPSHVQVGGGITGGQVTLFTLDRSSAPPVESGNDTYLGSMYYDTLTGRIQCYESDGWGACGSAPDTIITLTPEYTGAVLAGPGDGQPAGVGTMTADFCSNDTDLEVNTGFCDNGISRNYYKWTSPQTSPQTYSIYVSYKLPNTFKTFLDSDTIKLTALTDNTTNGTVDYEVLRSDGSDVSSCGSATTVTTPSADTWYTAPFGGDETDCDFEASDYVIFKINVTAQSNANVYVENLEFIYLNQ